MIQRPSRVIVLLSLLGLLFLGCADHDKEFGDAKVNVAISALTAADVASVTVSVTASDISPPIPATLTKVGSSWQGTIPNIPAGTNRTFSAQAFDAASVLLFSGSATNVTITAGNTAVVMIVLQEATPPGPFDNSAPYITSFWISSDQVEPSTNVILGAQATDPDGDPLTYAWTSTGGTFSAPTLSDTNWQSPSTDGAYPITITVADPFSASDSLTATVTVQSPTVGAADVDVTFNVYPRVTNVTSTLSRLQNGGPATMLHAVANDADGDPLTYAWSSDCAGMFGAVMPTSPDTTFALTDPAAATCALTVTITDQRGGQTTGTIHVVAGPPPSPNRAPVITASFQSSQTADHNGQVTLHIEATDPDGDPISFGWTATDGSVGGSSGPAGTSEVIWYAPSCFIAPATVTGHAIDGTWDTWVDFTITNESGSCGSTFNGNMYIYGPSDLAQLNGVTLITGNLHIEAPALTSIDLSSLTEIDGELGIYSFGGSQLDLPSLVTLGSVTQFSAAVVSIPQVTSTSEVYLRSGSVSMPALTSVIWLLFNNAPADASVNLPLLDTVSSYMQISTTEIATFPSLPSLTTLGQLYLSSNTNDLTVSLPALTHLDTAYFTDDPAVIDAPLLTDITNLTVSQSPQTDLTLPSSIRVGYLSLQGNPQLSSVSITYASSATLNLYSNASLATFAMPGVTDLNYMQVYYNPLLTSISFPDLSSIAGNVYVTYNDTLSAISVPNLTSIGGQLYVANNPQLGQCRVDDIAAQANPAGGVSYVGNTGSCP